MNAERLIQLANFTATSVGTDGGFWKRRNAVLVDTIKAQARQIKWPKHLTEHNGREDLSFVPDESSTTNWTCLKHLGGS